MARTLNSSSVWELVSATSSSITYQEDCYFILDIHNKHVKIINSYQNRLNCTFKNCRMKLLIFLTMIGLVIACENEIKQKLNLFVKGKDLGELFKKYAPSGYILNEGIDKFLTDADVEDWCRWPTLVIEKLDLDGDAKISWEEIYSQLRTILHEEL